MNRIRRDPAGAFCATVLTILAIVAVLAFAITGSSPLS